MPVPTKSKRTGFQRVFAAGETLKPIGHTFLALWPLVHLERTLKVEGASGPLHKVANEEGQGWEDLSASSQLVSRGRSQYTALLLVALPVKILDHKAVWSHIKGAWQVTVQILRLLSPPGLVS